MPLKSFKPVTPANRYKMLPGFDEITKSKPEKSLLEVKKRSGGRNNQGRITMRHIGGGHKKKYRLIDFKSTKRDEVATVVGIEYDPNRTCRIALLNTKMEPSPTSLPHPVSPMETRLSPGKLSSPRSVMPCL